MKNKIIIPILMFLLSLTLANAISFYEGNVVISSLKADVDITNNANVALNYTLSGNEKVNLNFNNLPDSAQITINGQNYGKSFDFDVKEKISIIVAYSTGLGTETIKEFSLNPNPLFNNAINSNRIISYSVKIKMPSGVNELLSSSETPSGIETESGRKIFAWQKANAYASTLSINWHSLNVNIDVERILPGELTDEFTVKNVIRNNGGAINNVKLIQSWLESDFDPASPMEEFERIQAGNDRRLEWKKEVASIPAGDVKEFSYKLKVLNRGQNVLFRPMYVYVNNALVKIVEKAEYSTQGIDIVPENSTSLQIQVGAGQQLPALSPESDLPQNSNQTQLAELQPGIAPNKTAKPELIVPPQQPSQKQPSQKDDYGVQGMGKESESFFKKLADGIFSPKRRSAVVWSSAIIVLLLLVVLVFVFLNRRKQEGIRF